ncbi:class A beta-lactamase-related serine hydrolase [Occultella glacieicola]|uniref:Class A beta-lactamase-related serine hydrolase n=1 Tax=Occultella glacieicola TaxID=2518684 RepID=A0ABY2E5K5_9MICO|nr:serine hydrolase domain-containing protein [Occultella glacieicola]TDE95849.1 class A beta-lactamase-related serine hydrolase [Occultella glacieicola]
MSTYPTLDRFDFPVALAVSSSSEVLSFDGDVEEVFAWKSVTKPLAALAVLVAVDRGRLGLDDPAGPEGSTVRHLLAHASGLPFEDGAVLQRPGLRRVYSNQGFDILGDHVAAAVGVSFPEWTRTAVLEPLELSSVSFDGSPAYAASGSTHDVLALGLEMLTPTLISADLGETACTVAFPGLSGVLPGFGRQEHNDWGLGYEIRDHKTPHWTGASNSPATFGHFGQSGSFVWVDPEADLVAAFLGARTFRSEVHGELWPLLNEEILTAHRR